MGVTLRWKQIKSGKSAYLDIYKDGERKYQFLKIIQRKTDSREIKREKKLMAENIRTKFELEFIANDHELTPSFRKNTDFIEYFQKFIDTYQGKGIRKFRYSLAKFKVFYKEDTLPFKGLTYDICKGYRDYLNSDKSGLTGETPYDYFKRFRTVVNKAVKDKVIKESPIQDLRISQEKGQLRKNVLSIEELRAMAKTQCGNNEVKKAFLLSCYSGLGEAEIRKLTWSKIQNGRILIYREKSGEQIINKLPDSILRMLGERKDNDEKVFSLPSVKAVSKCLKNWVQRAGISKNISFYCGRHTFATQLLINGANLKTVADCLGHASTNYVTKYLNYVNDLKDKAIDNLPELDL